MHAAVCPLPRHGSDKYVNLHNFAFVNVWKYFLFRGFLGFFFGDFWFGRVVSRISVSDCYFKMVGVWFVDCYSRISGFDLLIAGNIDFNSWLLWRIMGGRQNSGGGRLKAYTEAVFREIYSPQKCLLFFCHFPIIYLKREFCG